MGDSRKSSIMEVLTIGALGGMAGGAAEIGWIGLYGAATGAALDPIARGIAESIIPALATSAWAVEFGVAIHLSLAVALGIGLALVLQLALRRPEVQKAEFAVTMLILSAVWAVNFLIVLPHINPGFVHLLPYGVTLLSKLLFALAAATTFRARRRRLARIPIR